MKIGIVSLGGPSSKAIAKACKKHFTVVDELNIKEFEIHVMQEKIKVTYQKKRLRKYDCLYLRGSAKYALLLRAITRALHDTIYIPFGPETFSLGHDKFLTLLELQKNGVEIPNTYYAATTELAKKILQKEVTYPVIIKVPGGTQGKGVMVAESFSSAKSVLDMLEGFKSSYIIQEFVETKGTTDIRAVVVGENVVAAYKRKAAKGEVRTNVHSGGKRQPHNLTKKQEELALKSAKALGAEICGVDILNSRVPSVIELNLSPSVYAVKDVTGVDVPKEIAKYMFDKAVAFKKKKGKEDQNPVMWVLEKFLPPKELRGIFAGSNFP